MPFIGKCHHQNGQKSPFLPESIILPICTRMGFRREKFVNWGLRSVFVYVRDGGFALPSCPKSRENETANIGLGAQLLFLPGGLKIEKTNASFPSFPGKEALLLKERSDK